MCARVLCCVRAHEYDNTIAIFGSVHGVVSTGLYTMFVSP